MSKTTRQPTNLMNSEKKKSSKKHRFSGQWDSSKIQKLKIPHCNWKDLPPPKHRRIIGKFLASDGSPPAFSCPGDKTCLEQLTEMYLKAHENHIAMFTLPQTNMAPENGWLEY